MFWCITKFILQSEIGPTGRAVILSLVHVTHNKIFTYTWISAWAMCYLLLLLLLSFQLFNSSASSLSANGSAIGHPSPNVDFSLQPILFPVLSRDKAPVLTEGPEIKWMTSWKGEYVQDRMCVQHSLCLYVFVLRHGETHQCLNISTHPLRFNTPKKKEQKKKKGMTREKEMIIPWNNTYQRVTNQSTPKYQKNNVHKARSQNMNWWSNRKCMAPGGSQSCFTWPQMAVSSVGT